MIDLARRTGGKAGSLVREAGAVFASIQVRAMLRDAGLDDLESVLGSGRQVPSRHQYKGVATFETGGGEGRVYVKRQWRRSRLIPRPTDLLHGVAFLTVPEKEWRGLWRLRGLGLNTAEPLALYRGPRLSARSAVVTRAVPVRASLHQMLLDTQISRLSHSAAVSLGRAIGSVMRRIRAGRCAWRGADTKHFYPEQLAEDQWRLWLIDCEGVYWPGGGHGFQRDRAKLLGKLRGDGASEEFVSIVDSAARESDISKRPD